MKIVRTIAAVVVGYLAFALGSMLAISFVATGKGGMFVVLALVALAAVGLLAGVAVALVAGETRRLSGFIVAGLVALATLANLLSQLGAEPGWYKVATLLVTVPCLLFMTVRGSGKDLTPST